MPGNTNLGGVDLLTLEAVLTYLHNWFSRADIILTGEFTVSGGVLSGVSDRLQNGQYYRVVNSVFNDGLHQWGNEEDILTDETFTGAVWPLAVPRAVIALAGEIADWQTKYGDAASSPLSSESFTTGGYSYSKASGATGGGDGGTGGGWLSVFGGRLSRWRKL